MKSTRRIFLFTGKKSDVRDVMKAIDGFKAINVIYGKVTEKAIDETFYFNKSVVCSDITIRKSYESITVIGVNTQKSKDIHFILDANEGKTLIRKNFARIAEECNIDIGDHKSNSVKDGPSQNPMDCTFCRYFAGIPDHYQPSMYESKSFSVIPNMGHFVPGNLIIVPKSHIMSFAELSVLEKKELLEVIEDCKTILYAMYGDSVLIWENGSGNMGHGKDKTSIVHAHMHLVPASFNILESSLEKGIPLTEINYDDLGNYAEESYLLVLDYDNKWYISYNKERYIPRQYVRQLVAEKENIPGDKWNWRKYPFWDKMHDTLEEFSKYLSSNDVSKRILQRTAHFVNDEK